MADHREQRVERSAGEVAPVGDVGELPPPQGLGDVPVAVVAQAGVEVGGDRGEVVGELALHHLGHVGVEDEAVGVDVVEHPGQPHAHLVEVGLRTDVGLVLLARGEVALRAEPGTGQQHLADLEQQQRDRTTGVVLLRDRAQGEQEAGDLVGDLLGEGERLGVQHRGAAAPGGGVLGAGHSAARLPANARPRVTSSAYSRSPPTGSPLANRVTRKSRTFSMRVR